MRQRLGIAVALLSDPDLLLLDEPANGLDPAGIVAMREMLRYLTDLGKTVLVSSHILPEVQQLADVVGIIDRGRLVREGPLAELLAERRAGPRAGAPRRGRRAAAGVLRGAGRARSSRARLDGTAGGLVHGPRAQRPGIATSTGCSPSRASSPAPSSHQRPRVGVPVADRGRRHGRRQRDAARPAGGLGRRRRRADDPARPRRAAQAPPALGELRRPGRAARC